jgi:hypothetical protein
VQVADIPRTKDRRIDKRHRGLIYADMTLKTNIFQTFLLVALTLSVKGACGQNLEFSKSKKKFYVGKYYSATFILKNGVEIFGVVDTVTEKEITIKKWDYENNAYANIPVKIDEIDVIKKCKALIYYGPRGSLFRHCKKRHLKEYNYILKK